MSHSYRLGIGIVVGTIAVAALVCFSMVDPYPDAPRAAQDLGSASQPLGSFRFTERSGRTITDDDLADRVWIGAFIFTRCRTACPVITAAMTRLQRDLADTGVQLVSISVDPEHDTPERLTEFAGNYGADPDRWWFLTGPKEQTYDLIRRGFMLGVEEATPEQQDAGADLILHSTKLALVDRGNRVVGLFDSTEPDEIEALKARVLELTGHSATPSTAPDWARALPTVNASLNGLCAVLLMVGWVLIRAGRVRAHMVAQIAALGLSALFLGSYLVYHYQVGSVRFRGVGPIRPTYLTILLSHTVLAVVMVPMIVMTLVRALRERFDRHRRLAQVTFPIWLYVSITGVIIYLMLYQLDVPTALPGVT